MKGKRRRSILGRALLLSVVAGLILFMGWSYSQAHRAERAYTDNNLMKLRDDEAIPTHKGTSLMSPGTDQHLTPANTLRLRIPANSDDARDQQLKEEIRDAVLERFGGEIACARDAHEAVNILHRRLSEIEAFVNEHLRVNGVSYDAKARLRTVYFPEKTYRLSGGQIVYLPQGNYKALELVLGSGKGSNWWCVMYPPLCYFDLVQGGVVPGVSSSLPSGGPWTEGDAQGHGEEGRNGVIVIDEGLTEEVKVEVRSLLLDALRAGIIRIGKALSILAQIARGQDGIHNMD
jgi:stage II sporulation protein R